MTEDEHEDDVGTTTDAYITPTHVLEHLFCPRFTYFEHVLQVPEHQERRAKVRMGRDAHEERKRINPDYLRKKLGAIKREFDVEMASMKHRVKGIVDEVLWLKDESLAPFDYKFAEDKGKPGPRRANGPRPVFENQKMQSVLYGLLIQENYGKPVTRGYLCYTRSNYAIREIPFTPADFAKAEEVVSDVFEVIQTGVFPPPTSWRKRCSDCCYRNVCVK